MYCLIATEMADELGCKSVAGGSDGEGYSSLSIFVDGDNTPAYLNPGLEEFAMCTQSNGGECAVSENFGPVEGVKWNGIQGPGVCVTIPFNMDGVTHPLAYFAIQDGSGCVSGSGGGGWFCHEPIGSETSVSVLNLELMHSQMILLYQILILTASSVLYYHKSVLAVTAQPAFYQRVQTMVISQMRMACQMELVGAPDH